MLGARHQCLKGHSCTDPCIDVSQRVISSHPCLCSVPESLHCASSSNHHHVDHKPSPWHIWPNRNSGEASSWEPWLRRMPGHGHFGEGLLGLWAPSTH